MAEPVFSIDQIVRAIAVANKHPDPDAYIARVTAALNGDPMPEECTEVTAFDVEE